MTDIYSLVMCASCASFDMCCKSANSTRRRIHTETEIERLIDEQMG